MDDNSLDWGRIALLAGTAIKQLSRDDLDERVARIIGGDEPEGVSMTPFDDAGFATLSWAGRDLVRVHRADIIRRDTAGLN